jgi:hypothetical protein
MNLPYAKKAARKNRNVIKKVKKEKKVKNAIKPTEIKVKVNQYPFYPVDLINTWRFNRLPESPIIALCVFDTITEPYKISGHEPLYLFTTKDEIIKAKDILYHQIRIRALFKKAVSKWLVKRLKKVNEVDPITLEIPINPIRYSNLSTRVSYLFDATSLEKSWKMNLYTNDGLFTDPRWPTNPLTNLDIPVDVFPLLYKELTSKIPVDWTLSSLADCKFNFTVWKQLYEVPLKKKAIERVFKDYTSDDCKEYSLDFIEACYIYHAETFDESMFKWLFTQSDAVSYIEKWIKLSRDYYNILITVNDQKELGLLKNTLWAGSNRLLKVPVKLIDLYDTYIKSISRRVTVRRPRNDSIDVEFNVNILLINAIMNP